MNDKQKKKIWNGIFESFYPLANFGPPVSPNLINKMREALIKEVRVGVTISRSSLNMQTKFKKKVNISYNLYCDLIKKIFLLKFSKNKNYFLKIK